MKPGIPFLYRSLMVLLAVLLISACSNNPMLAKRGDPEFAPANPVIAAPSVPQNGGIYMANSARPLFEDITAKRVGDLLTVVLVEQTDASKTASTDITKENATNIAQPTVFGETISFRGKPLETKLQSDNEFTGEADSTQSNKLQGNITVTVSQVLPNGNLVVQGEKWIAINQGEEFVRLRGIVRPVDVGTNNTVLSTQVANAQISYQGKGALADSNATGWLSRFFLSPIWPY